MNRKQQSKAIVILAASLFFSSCGPGPLVGTTPAPASTNTPAPTATPLPTATSIPTPVPGRLMIVMNREVVVIPADPSYGSTEQSILIPQEKFDVAFPTVGETGVPLVSPELSPDGTKLAVVTCRVLGYGCENDRLYVSTVDLATKVEFTSYQGGPLAWSPTSDKLLIQGAKEASEKQVIGTGAEDFGNVLQLPPADAAFWTYDGKQIYFFRDGWHVINSDGSNEQSVPCDLCALAPTPTSFAVAQSPDGKYIAIGSLDGIVFIVRSDNFADFKLGSAGAYISRLFWSPDSTILAINIDTTTSQSDIIIMNTEGTTIEKMTRPEGVNLTILCGWSPDSQYVDYLSIRDKGSDLFLHKLGEENSIQRLSIETGNQSCPIWLK